MRILGVDLGERRVGLAVCDEDERIASPMESARVKTLDDALQVVCQAVENYAAGLVVLGHPRNLNGRPSPKSKEAERFASLLEGKGIAVDLWDERLTTAEADRHLKEMSLSRKQRKLVVDAVAAQRILESYLDARHRKRITD